MKIIISSIKFSSLVMLLSIFLLVNVEADWKTEREGLSRVYIVNGFRLFYTLDGKHALADISDSDASSIPDIVENTALQLMVANHLFSEVFGFIQPAYNSRYQNKLEGIDVHFLSIKSNGSSGDALIKYHYTNLKTSILSSLSITISSSIKAGNLTPAHELFHAYQNGYTLFKNRWFTEGTARWVEYAFKAGEGEQKLLPDTPQLLEQLLTKTYDAKYFWNRLAYLCSTNPKQLKIPAKLADKRYIPFAEKVIKGHELNGHSFIVTLFQNLSLFDNVASLERGLDNQHWKESEQKSTNNNKYILLALKNAIHQSHCHDKEEVMRFLVVVNRYVDFN